MKALPIFLIWFWHFTISHAQPSDVVPTSNENGKSSMIIAHPASQRMYFKGVSLEEKYMEQKDVTAATLAAIERFNEAFNRHDVDAVMANMTEDCVFENTNPVPDGRRIVGAADVRAYWVQFFTNNPDAKFEAEEIFATGDRCVVRWVYRKTKEGKPWHLRGVDIFKVRDGKVAEKFSYVKG